MVHLAEATTRPSETSRDSNWEDWIERIREGDMSGLAALYDATSTPVFSLILHILQDRELAEETLLDVYNELRQQVSNHNHRWKPSMPWLLALARNTAVERVRRSPHLQRLPEFSRGESFALDQLPDEQSSIIQMTYFGGLTARQVGSLLGLPLKYVTQQICLGMKKLRRISGSAPLRAIRVIRG